MNSGLLYRVITGTTTAQDRGLIIIFGSLMFLLGLVIASFAYTG